MLQTDTDSPIPTPNYNHQKEQILYPWVSTKHAEDISDCSLRKQNNKQINKPTNKYTNKQTNTDEKKTLAVHWK